MHLVDRRVMCELSAERHCVRYLRADLIFVAMVIILVVVALVVIVALVVVTLDKA